MRILIVNDDLGVVGMLRDYFSLRSFEVLTAQTAVDALSQAIHQRPEVVILDLDLPDFSGEQVLQTLKKLLPRTRILILTGQSGRDIEARLYQLGCDALVEKGESLTVLEGIVEGWRE